MNNFDITQVQGQVPVKQEGEEKKQSSTDSKITHLIKFLGLTEEDMKKYENIPSDKDLYFLAGKNNFGIRKQKNLKKAALLYKFAILKGNEEAKYYLGILYDDGMGVEKDTRKAAELFQMCADQRIVNSGLSLCFYYGQGKGVGGDAAKSRQFLNIWEKKH